MARIAGPRNPIDVAAENAPIAGPMINEPLVHVRFEILETCLLD